MKHFFRLSILLCLFAQTAWSQSTVVAYEYWFDGDYAHKVYDTVPIPQQEVTIAENADATALTPGLHTFNFRSVDDSNRWSIVLSQYIERLPDSASSQITGYEYWLDYAWQNKVSVTLASPASVVQTIDSLDFSAAGQGLHTFNIRYHQTNGAWSSLLMQYIEKLPAENSSLITGYEYWLDQNWQNKISVTLASPASVVQTIDSLDMSGVAVGLHSFNIRYHQTNGTWSSTLTQYIEKLPDQSQPVLITAYRYWTSDQDSIITEVNLANPVSDFSQLVDANLLDRTLGDKNFTIQFKDNKGRWSSPLSDSITNIGEAHLDAIVPAVGGNTGDVTTTLYGGFFEGTHVMLINVAGDTIHAPDSLIFINGGTDALRATFDLRNQPVGYCDVVVKIDNDTTMILPGAFQIVAGIPASPWADLIGFSSIRLNTTTSFTLTYGNNGNVDARAVIVGFAFADTSVIVIPKFDFSFPVGDSIISFDTVPVTFVTDTLLDEVRWYKVYTFVLPIIGPGETGYLNFQATTSTTNPIQFKVWAHAPLYQSPLSYDAINCINDFVGLVATAAGFANPGISCVYSVWDNLLFPFVIYSAFGKPSDEPSVASISVGIVKSAISCVNPIYGSDVSKLSETLSKAYTTYKNLNALFQGTEIANHCGTLFNELFPEDKSVGVVASYDPNDKIGPVGTGSHSYYNGLRDFPYIIHFENADTATAAAQTVLITDTLDQNVFDLSTLQLGYISFNDTIINLPSGVSSYEKLVDMRPRANLVVEVKANLDQSTGILTWSFKTLDPITLQPTTDPLLGFLPPNVTAPEGEGSVFFTVKVKDNVPLGTQIKNDATICFDNNPCMQTNEWSNTLDNVLPSSAVNALPAITYDSTFQVSWSGNDQGSGIMQYNIFVSTNGGAYKPWLVNTSLTSSMFSGKLDSLYSFYSIAVDTAGNKELAPASPDATTLVGLPTGLSNATIAASCTLFPNPSSGSFTISLINPKKDKVIVTALDSYGKSLLQSTYSSDGSRQLLGLQVTEVPDGVYFLEIRIGDFSFYKKLIVQK